MPIDYKSSVLFLHIPKNAGKSIETNIFGNKFIKKNNYSRSLINKGAKFLLNKSNSNLYKENFFGLLDYTFVSQHMTLCELRNINFLNKIESSSLIRFSVIRNPYSRMKSIINHWFPLISKIMGKNNINNQDDFINAIEIWQNLEPFDHNLLAHKRNQFEFLVDEGGEIKVENLLRFENISLDWIDFCEKFKLNYNKKLNFIEDKKYLNTKELKYNKDSAELVYNLYKKDFKLLGYSKEDF